MGKIKLDKNDVKEIKLLCSSTQMKDGEIAKIFGVSRKHINAIRNEQRWNYDYDKKENAIEEKNS